MAIPALSLPDPRTVHPYGTAGDEIYRSDFGDHEVRVSPGSKYGIDVNITWMHRGVNSLWHEYVWSTDNSRLEIRTTKFNYEKTSYGSEKDRLTAKAKRLIEEAEGAVKLDRLLERLHPRIMEHLCRGALELWRCAAIKHQECEAMVAARNGEAIATYRRLEKLDQEATGSNTDDRASLEQQYDLEKERAQEVCKKADRALQTLTKAEQRLAGLLDYTRQHSPRTNLPSIFDTINPPAALPRI